MYGGGLNSQAQTTSSAALSGQMSILAVQICRLRNRQNSGDKKGDGPVSNEQLGGKKQVSMFEMTKLVSAHVK
jgi:hypothetical protein